jgi:hypothetical protein
MHRIQICDRAATISLGIKPVSNQDCGKDQCENGRCVKDVVGLIYCRAGLNQFLAYAVKLKCAHRNQEGSPRSYGDRREQSP